MKKPSDIGIIEIDSYGFINRWYPADRKKFISDHLPPGPGWVPEHYISFISNFCDGAWVPPKYFIHTDKNNKNNQPENISIVHHVSDNSFFDNIRDLTDFGIPRQEKEKFETDFVLGGFYQEKIYAIPKINRCELCGMPLFGHPYQTDYMDHSLCIDCYRDYYSEEDSKCDMCLLTDTSYDPIYNIFIDYHRGLTKHQLMKKYNNADLIEVMLNNPNLFKDDYKYL